MGLRGLGFEVQDFGFRLFLGVREVVSVALLHGPVEFLAFRLRSVFGVEVRVRTDILPAKINCRERPVCTRENPHGGNFTGNSVETIFDASSWIVLDW